MTRNRLNALGAWLAIGVWLAAGAQGLHGQAGGADALAIVVHRGNPVESLTLSELRRIFMLETQNWPHGRRITVVLRETLGQDWMTPDLFRLGASRLANDILID